MNHKRVERIWRREGPKVPQKQPKRGRLWLNDGSCLRLRPAYPGHVEAYGFVEARTHGGRKFRTLTIIDEASRECLALIVARQLKHEDVLPALAELFIARGPPAHIRSDNGSEFIATAVQKWLRQVGVKTLYIVPGAPWENGYNMSLMQMIEQAAGNDALEQIGVRASISPQQLQTMPGHLSPVLGPKLPEHAATCGPGIIPRGGAAPAQGSAAGTSMAARFSARSSARRT